MHREGYWPSRYRNPLDYVYGPACRIPLPAERVDRGRSASRQDVSQCSTIERRGIRLRSRRRSDGDTRDQGDRQGKRLRWHGYPVRPPYQWLLPRHCAACWQEQEDRQTDRVSRLRSPDAYRKEHPEADESGAQGRRAYQAFTFVYARTRKGCVKSANYNIDAAPFVGTASFFYLRRKNLYSYSQVVFLVLVWLAGGLELSKLYSRKSFE